MPSAVKTLPTPAPLAALCHAGSVQEWVLFLGAGASVSAPTRLPPFPSLARGVLAGVGWGYRNGYWRQRGFPTFVDPGRVISPEVLFGTLQAFDVDFAPKIADVLDADRPNAAHRVAAAVIESWHGVDHERRPSRRGGMSPTRTPRAPPLWTPDTQT